MTAPRAAHLYTEAALPCAMAGQVHDMLAVAERSEAAHPPGGARSLPSVAVSTIAFVLTGHSAQGRHRLVCADRLTESADPVWDLHYLTMLGQAQVWLEEFTAARRVLGGVLDKARRVGAPSSLALALSVRCELDWWTGHWVAAYADAVEAMHWAEELRQTASLGYTLGTLARLDAARGDTALCRQRVDRAQRDAGPFGIGIYVSSVLGFAALAEGDLETAVQHLDQAWDTARDVGLGATNVAPFAGDLIEAHIRAGHPPISPARH